MYTTLPKEALDLIFHDARSHFAWQDKKVDEKLLSDAWDIARMAPTSANCSPIRIHFVTSAEAKERLKPCLMEGNVEKTMTAPVTAIFAQDMQFYDLLPELFPHDDARSWFAGNDPLIAETAFRNSTLQCAYYMLALRAVGLDCGPMSGFDQAACDAEFFADGRYKSNFLCNIGYGDSKVLFPRAPRLDFAQACKVL